MANCGSTTAGSAPVPASGLETLRTQSISQAQIANGAFIVGGVLAVGAAVEAIFTDWSGERTIHGGSAISTNANLRDEVMLIVHPSSPAAAMPRAESHQSPSSC